MEIPTRYTLQLYLLADRPGGKKWAKGRDGDDMVPTRVVTLQARRFLPFALFPPLHVDFDPDGDTLYEVESATWCDRRQELHVDLYPAAYTEVDGLEKALTVLRSVGFEVTYDGVPAQFPDAD